MKKKIIIISGDPNSVNSEIIFKTWKKLNKSIRKKIYLISNFRLLEKQFKKLKYKVNIMKVKKIYDEADNPKLKVVDINLKFKDPFNVNKKDSAIFIKRSLNLAHNYGLLKEVKGIINCAINKNLLQKEKWGVTEFFASKCKINNDSEVMLIKTKKFSVSPITTHIDIKEVSKKISKNKIINKVITINKWFQKELKKKPKIGILGLNPHNAEYRKKSEEIKKIIPAIMKLKKRGINIEGPLVSDTVFMYDFKKYDVLVGMFHDQVLTPLKAIYKFDAINVTLGLKYLRASPDHGTAKNLICKNKASPKSLIECINFIDKSK